MNLRYENLRYENVCANVVNLISDNVLEVYMIQPSEIYEKNTFLHELYTCTYCM